MDLFNQEFGPRLRAIRENKGMTQIELARKTNMSNQTISNLERGYTKTLSYNDLKSLAKHLGCEIGDLMPDANRYALEYIDNIDIMKHLEHTFELLENYTDLKFYGKVLDQETRELLKSAIEHTIKIAALRRH